METTEIINGFTVTGAWKNGQKSMTATATKGGKKYFLKKYTKYVLAPEGSAAYTEETRAFKKKCFDEFVGVRRRVITQIEPVAGTGGNVVIPKNANSFVYGEHYYEATEFIDGVVPDEEMEGFLASLSGDERMLMMKTAAGAMMAVHGRGIIHSDIKMKNIIVVKNSSKNFVAKLIDFDSSYPADEKKFIGGDEAYFSPELAEYVSMEEDAEEDELEELLKPISPKTDIFSLGVIFHYYLSQTFPTAVALSPNLERMKAIAERAGHTATFYAWQLVSEGCELKLSDEIKSEGLKALILDMLDKDPEKRPTAMQVLHRLKMGDAPVPARSTGAGSTPSRPTGATGTAASTTPAVVPTTFDDVWPEHGIAFDLAKMSALGFLGASKEAVGGKNGYKLFRRGGTSMFYTVEKLLSLKYAKRAGADAPRPEAAELDGSELIPWPEHAIEFLPAKIKERQFTKVEKGTLNGIKGYYLSRTDGMRRFMRVEMVLNLGMAKRV